ncbi:MULTISPECIES: hypothetical protein [Sphingobacterium]|uniref:hypothetical protein n=1 Tax=Sphingobacterium TaxID=28453 RepID=UPI0010512175|nr:MULTISPECIES: hypothetical protein [Sphingobacterium]MCW2263058.1 hypothetical protein [Sphingobacterium kitahiroshimense]
MILRRIEIMDYLQLHLKNIELSTIELEDKIFTMSLKSDGRREDHIQKLVRSKGLEIGFLSFEIIE